MCHFSVLTLMRAGGAGKYTWSLEPEPGIELLTQKAKPPGPGKSPSASPSRLSSCQGIYGNYPPSAIPPWSFCLAASSLPCIFYPLMTLRRGTFPLMPWDALPGESPMHGYRLLSARSVGMDSGWVVPGWAWAAPPQPSAPGTWELTWDAAAGTSASPGCCLTS